MSAAWNGLGMRRPTGFTLLGLFLGWKALAGFLLAIDIGLEPLPDSPPAGLSFIVVVFAAVAAEALWRCRPWVMRANLAYVCASIFAPLAGDAAAGHLTFSKAMFSIAGYGMIAALPLWYVDDRAAKLFGRQAAPLPTAPAAVPIRVPAPRP
jgi:hypothetical protein